MTSPVSILRALADPTRLRIFLLARELELAVGELALVLAQSQPRVSRHLKILTDAALIDRAKEGAWVFVRLAAGRHVAAAIALVDACDASTTADLDRLAAVRAERAAAAATYFATHAAEWDSIRALHVAEHDVETAVTDLLGTAALGRLIDIGTGTGRMIELLGPRAVAAVGFDCSPEMLRLARGRIEAAGMKHAEVRHGDMYALPGIDASVDTAVLHQVLHFADRPTHVIGQTARLLAPGGRLLIVDFAAHDREEFRTRHAHVRLGFDDAQIDGWMQDAGLELTRICRLAPDDASGLTVTLWLGERQRQAARQAA